MNLEDVLLRGNRSSQPNANTVPSGTLYFVINEGVIEQSDGTNWQSYSRVQIVQPVLYEENYQSNDILSAPVPAASGLNIQTALVATSETQVSGAGYADLATPGPSVTLVTGTSVLVWVGVLASRAGVGNSAYCSPAISGATTQAATDTYSGSGSSALSTGITNLANCFAITGLTPGSNTFKLQYKNDGGSTWTFRNRTIVVLAL